MNKHQSSQLWHTNNSLFSTLVWSLHDRPSGRALKSDESVKRGPLATAEAAMTAILRRLRGVAKTRPEKHRHLTWTLNMDGFGRGISKTNILSTNGGSLNLPELPYPWRPRAEERGGAFRPFSLKCYGLAANTACIMNRSTYHPDLNTI